MNRKVREQKTPYSRKYTKMGSQARTLPAKTGYNEKTGWEIIAEIHEDYYTWINNFIAINEDKKYKVVGDFEDIVHASSKEALDQFVKDHPFEEWDYMDI